MLVKCKCNDSYFFAQYIDFDKLILNSGGGDSFMASYSCQIQKWHMAGSIPATPFLEPFHQYVATRVQKLEFKGKSGKIYAFENDFDTKYNTAMYNFVAVNVKDYGHRYQAFRIGSIRRTFKNLIFSYDKENDYYIVGVNYSMEIPTLEDMKEWGLLASDMPSFTPCQGLKCGFVNAWFSNPKLNHMMNLDFNGYKGEFFPNIKEFFIDVLDVENLNIDSVNDEENEEDGGKGVFDKTTELIDFPTHTVPKITDSGFLSLYSPTLEQIRGLATYLMSNDFDLTTFSKAFLNPLQAILGLAIVPINIPTGVTSEIKVGNFGTGVYANKINEQFYTITCGSIEIKKYYDTFIDLETKIEIFLPYIGVRQLDAKDVVGKTIELQYRIDVLTGSLVAFIKAGGTLLYTFSGQASMQIPVHQTDMTSIINTVLSTVTTIGASVAEGGLTGLASGLASTATSVANTRVAIQKSGSVSGVSGFLNIQKPYLMLTIPRVATPKNLNTYKGYISYITKKLSTVKGYTEVHKINLKLNASIEEKKEIENLLTEGVII